MKLEQKIDILSEWGQCIKKNIAEIENTDFKNHWFTKENVHYSINSICSLLTTDKLCEWLHPYKEKFEMQNKVQNILVLSAGNIPIVGFHDFLSVLITGNRYIGKLSSNDNILLPKLIEYLLKSAPELKNQIHFTNTLIHECDKVIATGSNNSARFFNYYFSNKPHIIRSNRNSCAIIDGSETIAELEKLGLDIFLYFGLGCRSVSKLFVPENYIFDDLSEALRKYKKMMNLKAYQDNYKYQKAIYTINEFPFFDHEFYLLTNNVAYASPISTLYYEHYDDINSIDRKISEDRDLLQCIVKKHTFGTTQQPQLSDYADNIDTIAFIISNS